MKCHHSNFRLELYDSLSCPHSVCKWFTPIPPFGINHCSSNKKAVFVNYACFHSFPTNNWARYCERFWFSLFSAFQMVLVDELKFLWNSCAKRENIIPLGKKQSKPWPCSVRFKFTRRKLKQKQLPSLICFDFDLFFTVVCMSVKKRRNSIKFYILLFSFGFRSLMLSIFRSGTIFSSFCTREFSDQERLKVQINWKIQPN